MVRKKVIKALHKKAILRTEFVLRGSTPLYIQANEMAFRPEKGVVSWLSDRNKNHDIKKTYL